MFEATKHRQTGGGRERVLEGVAKFWREGRYLLSKELYTEHYNINRSRRVGTGDSRPRVIMDRSDADRTRSWERGQGSPAAAKLPNSPGTCSLNDNPRSTAQCNSREIEIKDVLFWALVIPFNNAFCGATPSIPNRQERTWETTANPGQSTSSNSLSILRTAWIEPEQPAAPISLRA